ncbi:MAG: hypothetical protein R2751_13820 [Bacteroidales bacterium]
MGRLWLFTGAGDRPLTWSAKASRATCRRSSFSSGARAKPGDGSPARTPTMLQYPTTRSLSPAGLSPEFR